MAASEWSLSDVFEVLAGAASDRDMLVWQDTRRTWTQVAARIRNLAGFLARSGIGVRRERGELARWECGQATVALLLYNCPEYVEAMLGCFRARAVPFNVNQHYRPAEIASLFEMLSAEAVVYHRALGPLVREAMQVSRSEPEASEGPRNGRDLALIEVDDGSGAAPLAGSTSFEDAASKGSAAADLPVHTR